MDSGAVLCSCSGIGRISGERERERERGRSGSQLTREDWMIDQAAAEQVKPFIYYHWTAP